MTASHTTGEQSLFAHGVFVSCGNELANLLVCRKALYGPELHHHRQPAHSKRKTLGPTVVHQSLRHHHARHRPQLFRPLHQPNQRPGQRTHRLTHNFLSDESRGTCLARRILRRHPVALGNVCPQSRPPYLRIPLAICLVSLLPALAGSGDSLRHSVQSALFSSLNARPHLDGSQSNHASPARFSAVVSHTYCVRTLSVGFADPGPSGTF